MHLISLRVFSFQVCLLNFKAYPQILPNLLSKFVFSLSLSETILFQVSFYTKIIFSVFSSVASISSIPLIILVVASPDC